MSRLPFFDEAARGTLVLGGTLPSGAEVQVDDAQRSGTSFELRPGFHRLRVKAEGHVPFERRVYVPGRRTITVPVVLQRR